MWNSHRIICLCDNQAVVVCLRSQTSREGHIMHLLRTLAFVEAQHSFSLTPQYIDTKASHPADDLSRDNFVPHAYPEVTPLPQHVLNLLLDQTLDWVSPS
jgi:hypothetical protein